jgi:hypothetical protein
MSYTPNNQTVYMAAFTGAIAGMGSSNRTNVSDLSTTYDNLAVVAGAYAEEFDTTWGTQTTNPEQIALIEKLSEAAWVNRFPSNTVPSPYNTIVKGLIAIIVASDTYLTSQGVTPGTTGTRNFVFRPGETKPAGNVFNNFHLLYPYLLEAQGPKLLQIDDSIVSPAVIPAGTYDLDNVALMGNLEKVNGTQLQLANGVVFTNFGEIRDTLFITSVSTAPVHIMTNNDLLIAWRGATISSAPGAAPLFKVPAGVSTTVVGLQGGVFGATPGNHLFDIDAGAAVTMILDFAAGLSNDVLSGAGVASVVVTSQSAFINTPFPILQPALPALVALVFSFAEFTFFQGLNPAHWVAPPPSNVSEAINRIAALLDVLNAGPIPL